MPSDRTGTLERRYAQLKKTFYLLLSKSDWASGLAPVPKLESYADRGNSMKS
jgi:hypothetical protein